MRFKFEMVRPYMAIVGLEEYDFGYGFPNGSFDLVVWSYGLLKAEDDYQAFSLYISSPAYSNRRAIELGVRVEGERVVVTEVVPVGEGCDDEKVLEKLMGFFEMVISGEREFTFPLDLTEEEISSFIRWFSVS